MSDQTPNVKLLELTVDIVAAYAGNNTIASSDMVELIETVHGALSDAVTDSKEAEPEPLEPAVAIKKSVTPDFIICLEDGKKFKSLKRHIRTHYGLTPDEYRERWGLDANYPMVAPNYTAARAQLARDMGLGLARKGKKKKK
ncbi:MucR family transcriptional regulator [uncultured Roseibium sp.]|uniref:MucR family transcriptional regulator n=1 Tax=uncultured Roseibium sp. TaxID=1936171 RepID=UPI00260AB74E|nr:MucR family transcriptional regulator [uncultured Roseibium sp.]